MRNGRDEILGALLLFREAGARLPPFSDANAHLSESLASQAAIAITKNRLVAEFRTLFEGVIQLTARAIDENRPTRATTSQGPDPHRADRRQRLRGDHGALKDFTLTPEERYELRVAALLHDCGKVVTPVHVMDKATKLEAIFDRIELVETRFEILRRDLRLASRPGDEATLAARLRGARRRSRVPASMQRGQRGHARGGPRSRAGDRAPPPFAAADGSTRAVVESEEVENLTISTGTLNYAEREIIQQHVVTTIKLLERAPVSAGLRNVPGSPDRITSRIDGSGYPSGLRREQISMQGRILGLADVFEALTAKDRPYKDGRTLSETLEILASMRNEGHIDPDLHDSSSGRRSTCATRRGTSPPSRSIRRTGKTSSGSPRGTSDAAANEKAGSPLRRPGPRERLRSGSALRNARADVRNHVGRVDTGTAPACRSSGTGLDVRRRSAADRPRSSRAALPSPPRARAPGSRSACCRLR